MKCLRCNRPLLRFAVSVQTRDGPQGWGPDCARKVMRKQARAKREKIERDQRTIDWVGGI